MEISISLMEASGRVGGVIATEHTEGFLLEGGPDSFLAQKPAAIELCRELGLASQLIPSNDARRKTFVLRGGKLRELPDGLMFVVPTRITPLLTNNLLSIGAKARLILSPLNPPAGTADSDVSASQLISQRFGKEVLERLAEPLLAAVYGSDVDALSARAIFPQLIALEREYGSLWKAFAKRAVGSKLVSSSAPRQSVFVTLRGVGWGKWSASCNAD